MAGWIPATARSVIHEPRNGILLCKNHHGAFDHHQFFIRFVREVSPTASISPLNSLIQEQTKKQRQEYVLINLKHRQDLEQFHGHALHLGINDPRAPWPTLFLLHERITVAKSPFHPPRWIPAPVEFPPISSASGLDPTEPFGPAALNQGELHQTSAGGRPSFAGSHRIPDTRPPASGGSGGENTRNTGVSATHGTALGAQLPSIHECASNGITSPSSQDNSGHSHCVSYSKPSLPLGHFPFSQHLTIANLLIGNQKYQQDTQSARSSTTAPATWSAASNPAADVAANNSRFSPETVVANFAFQKLYVDDIRDPGTYFSKEMMENLGFVWDCPEATTAWSGSTTENIQRWNAMRKGEEYCNQD